MKAIEKTLISPLVATSIHNSTSKRQLGAVLVFNEPMHPTINSSILIMTGCPSQHILT